MHYYEGWVFIVLGLSRLIVAFIESRIGKRFCRFKKAIFASSFFLTAVVTSLLNQSLKNYELCFLIGALWGGSSVYTQTIAGDLISHIYPEDISSGFPAYNLSFTLGLIFIVIVNLILRDSGAWILLGIMFLIGCLSILLGLNLKYVVGWKEVVNRT